jgi:HEAT repeat protein
LGFHPQVPAEEIKDRYNVYKGWPAGAYRAWVYLDQEKDPVLVIPFTIGARVSVPGSDEASKSEILKALRGFQATKDVTPIKALVERGAPVVPGLAAGLSDPDPVVRRLAIVALGSLGLAAAPAEMDMTSALSDPDQQVRQMAFQAVPGLGTLMILEPFATRVVSYVVDHPAEHDRDTMASLGPMLLPRLVDRLGTIVGMPEREAVALSALGKSAIPALVRVLKDRADAGKRRARGEGRFHLIGFEDRTQEWSVAGAAYALARTREKDPDALAVLRETYGDPTVDLRARCVVGAALGVLDVPPPDLAATVLKALALTTAGRDSDTFLAVFILPPSVLPDVLPAVRRLAEQPRKANDQNWAKLLSAIGG